MEEIICKKCGVRAAADETFCGGCGAFLEWEGERVVVEPVPPVDMPVTAVNELTAASSAVAPVAVQPAVPIERPKPQPRVSPGRRAEPGDIFCGGCGQPNNPERRFCRQCGRLLADQVGLPARLPWWKRIFHRHKRAKGATAAPADGAGRASGAGATNSGAAGRSAPGSSQPQRSPSPPAAPAPAHLPGAHYPSPPRQTPGGRSTPSPYRPPVVPTAARSHPVRGKLFVVLLLVVVVFSVDPSLRHMVSTWYSEAKDKLVPSYSKVAVEDASATGHGDCGPAQLQGNDTIYWYTRAAADGAQALTISIAPSFTGTITKIAFTPLTAPTNAPQSGQASPHPVQMVLSSKPAGPTAVINLADPPTFQQENIKVPRPSQVTLRLVTTDAGATAKTCAETGVVLYQDSR
jgi:hypothetical protein